VIAISRHWQEDGRWVSDEQHEAVQGEKGASAPPRLVFVPAPPRADSPGLTVDSLNLTTQRAPGVSVRAWVARVRAPVGFVRALPPTAAGCVRRAKPSESGKGFAWTVNGGPFSFKTGGCLGGLVSDGELVAPLGASDAVRWALGADSQRLARARADAGRGRGGAWRDAAASRLHGLGLPGQGRRAARL
jgi:hypothetical protein